MFFYRFFSNHWPSNKTDYDKSLAQGYRLHMESTVLFPSTIHSLVTYWPSIKHTRPITHVFLGTQRPHFWNSDAVINMTSHLTHMIINHRDFVNKWTFVMVNHLLMASNIHTNCELSDVFIGKIWFALLYLRRVYKHRTIKWSMCVLCVIFI